MPPLLYMHENFTVPLMVAAFCQCSSMPLMVKQSMMAMISETGMVITQTAVIS